MSRGPGRIERAIKELFAANPDLAFGVVDLVEHCYPGATGSKGPEKKHTVSVIRAARRVVDSDPDWEMWRGEGQGGALVFSNEASLQSHCLGILIADSLSFYRSPKRAVRKYGGSIGYRAAFHADDRASLLAMLAPGGSHGPGSLIDLAKKHKKYVDLHIAERDGDPRAVKIRAQIEAEDAARMAMFRAICRG